MSQAIGLRALALAFPETVRTNDYYRAHYPAVVEAAAQKTLSKLWQPKQGPQQRDAFSEEMAPFLEDPFRGTVERRVLRRDESLLALETRAARQALAAANLEPQQVDLLLCTAMLPATTGIGDAAWLAAELGLGPSSTAWNFESACSGALVGLQIARSLILSGEYRNVLVVVGCSYTQNVEETDSLGWVCGDGAAAFVVDRVPEGQGLIAMTSTHTAQTCGSMRYDMVAAPGQAPRLLMKAGSSKVSLQAAAEGYLRTTCEAALHKAGVSLEQVDFFIFNTPLAWYASFCARALGVSPERTLNTYPLYANTGPVLMPTNLYHAAQAGYLQPGHLVLLYTVGSVSSVGAAVMRWSEVGLGPSPVSSPPPRGAAHWRPGA